MIPLIPPALHDNADMLRNVIDNALLRMSTSGLRPHTMCVISMSTDPEALFKSAKRALQYAARYGCTIDMLYLDDLGLAMKSLDDMGKYDGKVSSCIDIVAKLCEKHRPVKAAEVLRKRYKMEMSHIHKCISVYLGGLGTMDDEYIKKYPESNLSSLGTTSTEYDSMVKYTMTLAGLMLKAKLPQYNLDSFSIVYSTCELDLDKTFDGMKEWIDIALQYGQPRSAFASYNGDEVEIRRRIAASLGKNIPSAYADFTPRPMDKNGVIMARWDGRNHKVYRDKFIFSCDGRDLENIGGHASQVASAFNIDGDMAFVCQSNTKAHLKMEIGNWNAVVLEHLIRHDDAFSRIMSITNGVLDGDSSVSIDEALHRNRTLIVYIAYPHAKYAFRYNGETLKISITSMSIEDTVIVVSAALAWRLLKEYNRKFADIYEMYSIRVLKNKSVATRNKSRIDDLRARLPELFANNYTRECHNLPLMLDTKEEAEEYRKMGRLVIKYPLRGKYSRWFTSPSDDLYVGLKLNRLSNKDKFKHIVTCYSSNHYESPNRETYIYYRGNDSDKKKPTANFITLKILPVGRRGPLPVAMMVEHDLHGYMRLGTGGSFMSCIAHALDVDTKKFPKLVRKGLKNGLLNVVRQEMWDKTDEEILAGIHDDLDGTTYYRLFEEIYECNILLVEIGHRGKYTISIPQCKGKYIWEPRKGRYIVVMKNGRKLYEDHLVSYELVVNHDKIVLKKDDPLVSAIVSFKLAHTVRSELDVDDIQAQYITEHGKCNVVVTNDGMTKCNSRPLHKPAIGAADMKKRSVIYSHLNDIMSSTAKHLYFPNNSSFVDWMGDKKDS